MGNIVQFKGTGPSKQRRGPQSKREVPWQFHLFLGLVILILGLVATSVLVIEDIERLSQKGEGGYVILYGIAVLFLMIKWFVREIYHEEYAEAMASIAGLFFFHAYNVSLESAYMTSQMHVAKWQIALFSLIMPESWAFRLANLIVILLLVAFIIVADKMGTTGTQMLFKAWDERSVHKKKLARRRPIKTRAQ